MGGVRTLRDGPETSPKRGLLACFGQFPGASFSGTQTPFFLCPCLWSGLEGEFPSKVTNRAHFLRGRWASGVVREVVREL